MNNPDLTSYLKSLKEEEVIPIIQEILNKSEGLNLKIPGSKVQPTTYHLPSLEQGFDENGGEKIICEVTFDFFIEQFVTQFQRYYKEFQPDKFYLVALEKISQKKRRTFLDLETLKGIGQIFIYDIDDIGNRLEEIPKLKDRILKSSNDYDDSAGPQRSDESQRDYRQRKRTRKSTTKKSTKSEDSSQSQNKESKLPQDVSYYLEKYRSVATAEEFYFQKANDVFQKLVFYLNEDEAQEEINFKNSGAVPSAGTSRYQELKNLWENRKGLKPSEFFSFLGVKQPSLVELYSLINQFIAYIDLNAWNKDDWNEYDSNRVLAKTGANQTQLIDQFLQLAISGFSFKPNDDRSIKKAVDYLSSPTNYFNIFSNTDQKKISKYFLQKELIGKEFHLELKEYFDALGFEITLEINKTCLYARVIYDEEVKPLWKDADGEGGGNSGDDNDSGLGDYEEDDQESHENSKDKIPFHNDVVAQEDKLGREPVAKAFVDLIKKDVFTDEMNHAFMVHLQGEWGAGKSTFLNLIKNQLNSGDEKWFVVNYNAWQNQHITPPWWTLIDQIYRQTKARDEFGMFGKLRRREKWRRIKLYSGWQKVIALFLTVVITTCLIFFGNSIVDYFMELPFFKGDTEAIKTGSAIGAFSKLFLTLVSIITVIFTFSKVVSSSFFMNSSEEANSFLKRSFDPMSRIKSHFGKLVDDINSKEKKRQLAIFIDDIDRCNRQFIVKLLEGIQTLFKEKRVLYIVAGDKDWISTSFENTYSEFNTNQSSNQGQLGELFLEKAFQLSLRMPNISEDSKKEYWSHILGISEKEVEEKVGIDKITPELRKEVEQELNSTREDIASPVFIKKFEKKHNLSNDAASSLIIEKKNETDMEVKHLLKDFHGMVETNPRSIIRLANNYTMTRSTLIAERKQVNAQKLFRWLILKDLFPNAMEVAQSRSTMKEFDSELKKGINDKITLEKCMELLKGNKATKGDSLTIKEIKEFEGI